MRVLDLFSGIGGFSLGLERAGMRTVAFCEIDPYCRKVLARHWPGVPCYDDVTTLTVERLAADEIIEAVAYPYFERLGMQGHNGGGKARGIPQGDGQFSCYGGIDVICGGFPCQDISTAGKGAGITGERSGLWKEYARIIGEVRPRYVIVENVAALLHRGLADVLGDLAALGYDAEWHCIPASAVGAPHRRDRIWIVAYANGVSGPPRTGNTVKGSRGRHANGSGVSADVADADQPRLEGWLRAELRQCTEQQFAGLGGTHGRAYWLVEPDVGRVAHGVPARVDRLKALGNAVVPQIPELIGRAIMATT